MKCNKCGQDIETNSKFCSNCGYAIWIESEYTNEDLKIESKKFEFNERSKLTWYGSIITEITCKEQGINIRKIKTLFLRREKMNKDIKYSDINSLECRTNLSIVYSGLGALFTVLSVSYLSLYCILISAILFILSFERILYINNGEIKVKDYSIKTNKFSELISTIERRANISAQVRSKKQNIINSVIRVVVGLFIMILFYGFFGLLIGETNGEEGKEYYINLVKNMDSGLEGYTLEELLKSTFEEYGIEPNIEWDYIEDKQIVSVTLSNNTNSISRYYLVKNAPNNIEEVYIDGSSINENLSNVIGEALDERYSSSEYNDEEFNDEEVECDINGNNSGYLDGFEYELTGEEFKANYSQNTDSLFYALQECKLDGKTKVKDSKLMNNTIELEWNELHTTEKGTVIEILYTRDDYLSYSITLLFTHDGVVSVTNMEAPGRSLKMTKDDKLNELNEILGK